MVNEMKKIAPNFWVITLMVFIAAFVRLLPHPPNFAPIAAMALFGGAYFNKRSLAFIVPLTAMFLTDAIIGFYSYGWIVYISFALIVLIGIVMLRKVTIKNVILASLTASVSRWRGSGCRRRRRCTGSRDRSDGSRRRAGADRAPCRGRRVPARCAGVRPLPSRRCDD